MFFIYIFFIFIFSIIIGAFNNNPGVVDFLRINIIYYFIFCLLISTINNLKTFIYIIKTIVLASNFISVYTILLLLVKLNIWPSSLFIYFDVTSNVGIHEGYIHLTNTNLSMMIFLLPFIYLLIKDNYKIHLFNKVYLYMTLLLVLIAVLISGRRILWISFIIPFYIAFV